MFVVPTWENWEKKRKTYHNDNNNYFYNAHLTLQGVSLRAVREKKKFVRKRGGAALPPPPPVAWVIIYTVHHVGDLMQDR